MIGQLTSSLVGFWLIGKCIKFLIDSIVHGRILFDIYGLSWKLIASSWNSLTSLLTHNHFVQQIGKTGPKIKEMDPEPNCVPQEPSLLHANETRQSMTSTYPVLNPSELTIQITAPDSHTGFYVDNTRN